ncbi:MAG: BTAD domain-containing putative transcriptional regulator, partial [Tepidanaerobacteraceae bacterium]
KNMRKIGLMNDGAHQNSVELSFENGFYIFHTGPNCIIDIDIFEKNIRFADSIKYMDSNQAVQKYGEALSIYRGQYLAENTYSEWIYPIRNRYHRLYVQAVLNLMELLKAQKRYSEIVDMCESIVTIEPYEEGIHIFYLEALIELKQLKNALSHYNYITSRMYREFSVEPTPVLKNIYRRIVADQDGNRITDLLFLGQNLSEDDKMEGALYCELDYFRTIYNLERRKSLRLEYTEFLGLVSVITNEANISKQDREKAMESLELLLINSLRKGDVFCRWNPSQILLLLTNVTENNMQLIEKRIQKRFNNAVNPKEFTIKIDFQPVTAIDPFIT